MIILIWIISVFILAVVIGEIRFRQLRTIRNSTKKLNVEKWTDSIDKNIDDLSIESSGAEFVPTTKLAMRGSWRLAQDLIMNKDDFTELRECEYRKSLH